MADRHMSVVDAHVILRREGKILLLRRAAGTYAAGQLCLASGHLEAGESIVAAAAREAYEETGIVLDPAGLRSVLTMHQRNPDGQARFGFFFEPGRWDGEPVNREPGKHSEPVWADPAALPADTVDYTAKAIAAIEAGRSFTMNGWDEPAASPAAEADGDSDVMRRPAETALTRAGLQAPPQHSGRHWTASAIILHSS
jgi:8-oxo-dGTP pyrophosphatase MutT (NUDIX family)